MQDSFGDAVGPVSDTKPDPFVKIDSARVVDICFLLRQESQLAFDTLMMLSGVDMKGSFAVVYHLHSLQHGHRLTLKAELPAGKVNIGSVVPVWSAANWFEREAAEMFGIVFDGHPDPRNLVLPEDWPGHPLRKDYEFPKEWHGMPLERPDKAV